MNDLLQSFLYYQEYKTDKEQKIYHLKAISSLLTKLIELDDDSLHAPFSELLDILKKDKRDKVLEKNYQKIWANIKKLVKEKHGLIEKGEIPSQYMALGMSFGLILGTAFVSLNPGFIAIGLPIGLAIGLSLGSSKEKALEEKGLIF